MTNYALAAPAALVRPFGIALAESGVAVGESAPSMAASGWRSPVCWAMPPSPTVKCGKAS